MIDYTPWMPRADEAFTFLQQLFKHAQPKALIEFRILAVTSRSPEDAKGVLRQLATPVTTVERLTPTFVASMLRENDATPTSRLCFSVNPRGRPGSTDTAVTEAVAIVADIDGKEYDLQEQTKRVRQLAEHLPLCAWTASGTEGHGHPYWRIEPTKDLEHYRRVVRRLRLWLQADATEYPSKVMRLPGGANWKSTPPTITRVTTFNEAPTHSLAAFEAALNAVGAAAAPTSGLLPAFVKTPSSLPPLYYQSMVESPVAIAFQNLAPRLQVLVTAPWGAVNSYYASRSEALCAVFRGVKRAQGTFETALQMLDEYSPATGLVNAIRERSLVWAANIWTALDEAADDLAFVTVESVHTGVLGERVTLRLRVVDGDAADQVVDVGTDSRKSTWTRMWLAFGFTAPPLGASQLVTHLVGLGACVQLRQNSRGWEVAFWQPANSIASALPVDLTSVQVVQVLQKTAKDISLSVKDLVTEGLFVLTCQRNWLCVAPRVGTVLHLQLDPLTLYGVYNA